MFHVKQKARKTIGFQNVSNGYIKCFTVKVTLQLSVKQEAEKWRFLGKDAFETNDKNHDKQLENTNI